MSKQSLLLVDGDTRSLRVLEVSLRKAGFSVTPAVSVGDALDKLEINPPDLIISETKFATELDGFELRRRLRGTPEWAEIPFIFLTAETAIENKIKGLELGVDDYLTKPIYIKEIVTRINILLQKKQRQFLDLRKDGTRFAGRVADMPVVDVIQTIEVSRKSGVIQFSGGPNRQAAIYFRDGKVIDAEAGTLQGEDAVYRLLTWNEGEFEVEFRTVRRREVIEASSQGLLMEGMRRLDEWSRLLEQLPPLAHRFEIDAAELATRLGEVPDDNNRILRLFDGKRTLLEVIDASDFGDLECLQAISRLYFEGLLIDLDPAVRNTGRTMAAQHVEEAGSGPHTLAAHAHSQTPIQAAASGPIDLAGLEARASQTDPETTLRDMPAQPSTTLTGMGAVSPSTTLRDMAAQSPPATTPETTLRGLHVPVLREPADASGPHPTATPPPLDSTAPVQPNDVIASEPLMAPNELAAETPRRRRDSAQAIDEGDVVAEEEVVLGPLAGGYRQSSLRLIDEAVAAAQLIEPSLFADDELAALGIKRATPEEIAAAQARTAPPPPPAEPRGFPNNSSEERQAEVARLKQELRDSDPLLDNAKPEAASSSNGRSSAQPRAKTVPPPIPIKAKELDDAPMLDSALLTSGEIRIPSEEELAELTEADLLTSGEIKIPSEAKLGAAGAPPKPPPGPKQAAVIVADDAPKGVTQGWDVPEVPADVKADAPKGVTQGWDVPDVPVDLKALADADAKADPSKAVTDRLKAEDVPKGVTQGWDVPEVPADQTVETKSDAPKTDAPKDEPKVESKAEEPKPDPKADVEAKVQATLIDDDDSGGVPTVIEADSKAEQDILDNELATDPSRKPRPFRPEESQAINMIGSLGRDRAEASGELRPPEQKDATAPTQRELVTIMPRRKTGEVTQLKPEDVATLDAKGQQKAKAAVEAIDKADKADKAEKDAKSNGFTKADTKPDTKPDTKQEKPAAKSAVETPPPRRVSVEGGVVVPQRGPGRFAQILIVLASLVGGVAVFSHCRKKSTRTPVVSTVQDASDRIVMAEPDASDYTGFGVDAGMADASVIAVRPDAKLAMIPDAGMPDAAVVAIRPDAAPVVPAVVDAGIDKNKEAAELAKKGRTKLSEGEPQQALDLFNESLKLKRDKRTFVDRGRALANLGQIDEAVSSYDDAIKMSESYAPAWEQKGLTLWSAQRYGDARPALEMYLQLQPDGPKSETIRKMLDEPR